MRILEGEDRGKVKDAKECCRFLIWRGTSVEPSVGSWGEAKPLFSKDVEKTIISRYFMNISNKHFRLPCIPPEPLLNLIIEHGL